MLALHCDIRIVLETASFGFTELRVGIPPSWRVFREALLRDEPEPAA